MGKIDGVESAAYKCRLEIETALEKMNLNNDDYLRIVDFINEKTDFESIRDIIFSIDTDEKKFYPMYLMPVMEKMYEEGHEELYNRVILLFLSFNTMGYIDSICFRSRYYDSMKVFSLGIENNVPLDLLMTYINTIIEKNTGRENRINKISMAIDILLKYKKDQVIENISKMNVEMRCRCLNSLLSDESEENTEVVIDYFSDNSKIVRQNIIELLKNKYQYTNLVLEKLSSNKVAARETAVRILENYLDSSADESVKDNIKLSLNNAFEKEKSSKLKETIGSILKIETPEIKLSDEDLVAGLMKGNKKSALKWLDFESLPQVKLKDKDELCSMDYLKAVLLCYADLKTIGIESNGHNLVKSWTEQHYHVLQIRSLRYGWKKEQM